MEDGMQQIFMTFGLFVLIIQNMPAFMQCVFPV